MNNENEEYRQKLNEIIIAKRQDLRHRQNRLNSNIFAGICKKIYNSTEENYFISANTNRKLRIYTTTQFINE